MASIDGPQGGPYRVRFRDPDGHSRSRTFKRKREAVAFVHTVESAKASGVFVDPRLGRVQVAQQLDRWLASVRSSLKPKTVLGYESLIRSQIVPSLGGQQLGKLKPSHVQTWISDMQERGLSPSRIREAVVVLRQALDTAVGDGALGRNVADRVKLPRVEQREAAYFDPATVELIADHIQEPYPLLVRVLGVVGPRFGEAAALRRRHVDLLRRRLRIEESLAEVSGRLHFGPTKTHAQRSVPLPPDLVDALESHLEHDVEGDPGALVFTSPDGAPLRYRNFHSRVWVPTLRFLGLPAVGLHALRHSAAARMISAGASPKAVQSIMGHRSAAFTLTVYGHLFDTDMDSLAERLSATNCVKNVSSLAGEQLRDDVTGA